TARNGNRLSALCMALAILFTINELGIWNSVSTWILIVIGSVAGILLGQKVMMIQMPQLVALLNGFGGAASAIVAATSLSLTANPGALVVLTAALALAVGSITFFGSAIAALKLQGTVSQKTVSLKGHRYWLGALLAAGLLLIILSIFYPGPLFYVIAVLFSIYGVLMTLRVGGADMPIIISFLNSLSGIAAAICGLAVYNILLAGAGALVGVAGMILTQLMCKAMNRNLQAVLSGFSGATPVPGTPQPEEPGPQAQSLKEEQIPDLVREAQKVIFVPGYGMAVSQAQQQVKDLIDVLESRGKTVKIAIHPVAGRMPGHMNVLLAEVGVPYEMLYDMDTINPEFAETDLVIVVGACDVINPAANSAEGTPIYGMPILEVEKARHILIFNLDARPGYSCVENSLYSKQNVLTVWGDAKETVARVTASLGEE
ncbi:MAG TPA: NAD(P)(+) transhydrogenase (Re/Si-specific) subunit beta, partial [Bacillota bacterium]|nr:NAD(P)(+) transhydrogenase (Re/Si-specific) subunit beta [Bacillota bacterium]